MPLFLQHTINTTTKLGIWHITEDENFFLTKVFVQKNITHPHKRLQHLAGRFLLQYLFPDFPYDEILIADTRKPFLPNEQYHFSISHCGYYAAAIVSSTYRVGIDIEMISEKAERIAHKFVHEDEEQLIINSKLETENRKLLTLLWSAKEALFKWYSLGEVDFQEHIQLHNIIQKQNNRFILPFVFKKDKPVELNITSEVFNDLVLSWVCENL